MKISQQLKKHTSRAATRAATKVTLFAIAGAFAFSTLSPLLAHASVVNPAPTAKISFSFDDGLTSATTQAAPTLAKYGLVGTDYVISGCAGMTTVPNTCHANTDASYMTWTQIQALQNTYKWEIGSHTTTHPYLATMDATDGQPNVLTPAQVSSEMTTSKAAFAAKGITATDFSTPYGDYNNATLAMIAKTYATHRGFADEGTNTWAYNDYLLNDYRVQEGVTVAQIKAKIDTAVANKTWLILTMHDIMVTPSTSPDDYQYSTAELDQIAAYAKTKITAGQLSSVTINQGTVTSTTNLLANSSFDSGIASGWTTPNAAAVTKDTANNGSYPSSTNSVKFAPSTTASRLYSPKVPVSSSSSYMLKSFLNVASRTSGQMEYYIDEYDVNGNWISGQFKKAEPSVFVEEMNFTYTPSSPSVATADIQLTSTANSGITAYVDNFQWFPLQTSTVVPTSSESFETGFNGWTTDSAANITIDKLNNGSPNSPLSSVKLVAGAAATNTHLFGPKTPVVSTAKYTITSYVNMKAITTNELGLYIDEYDVNGNWISGQYKTGVRTISKGDVSVAYTPTSASVKTASLQVIATGNSGITAYFDDVRWYTN
jgi:peptidoglycan/xylan/chitin deacetylase (PgdA/CDA1 family)